jgi:hypothetical protein
MADWLVAEGLRTAGVGRPEPSDRPDNLGSARWSIVNLGRVTMIACNSDLTDGAQCTIWKRLVLFVFLHIHHCDSRNSSF